MVGRPAAARDGPERAYEVQPTTQARKLYSYEYNDDGQVTKVTDGDGRVTGYQYDDGGHRTAEFPPGALEERAIAYDERDRVRETKDGDGHRVVYQYDDLDRLVELGQIVDDVYTPLQYDNYDEAGNLVGRYFADSGVQLLYNAHNQVVEVRNIRGAVRYDTYYRYDLTGNLTDIEDPGGRIKYTYDAANRLTFQSGPHDGMWAIFEYDDAGRRVRTRYPGEFRVRSQYDDSGRPTSLVAERSDGSTVLERDYTWNDTHGDTALLQSETRDGTTLAYRYDSQNQLISYGPNTYRLDRSSNLTSAEGRDFDINDAGQVGASEGITYTHDGAGNLTTGSGGELSSTYSTTDQLTSQTTHATRTGFTDDTADQGQRAVITTTNGTDVTEQVLNNTAIGVTGITTNGRRSEFARDPAGNLIGQVTEDGEILYAVTDYQGSTLLLVSTDQQVAARYTYTPYGTTTASGRVAAGNPFRWTGAFQAHDSHGSYLLGHRQYDPVLARFTQTDPSQQEPNPYTYALANPVSNTDPTGLSCASDVIGVVASSIGILGSIGLIVFSEGGAAFFGYFLLVAAGGFFAQNLISASDSCKKT